jgi:hypothetical protein
MSILANPFVQFIAASRRAIILLSFFLLAIGALMQAAYIFAPLESLPHRPFEEDTFFHLSVCRNLAAGKGLTIDGETPTSGAQPGTLVYSLAYLAAPDPLSLEALRLVRALGFFGSLLSTLAVFVCAFALLKTDTVNRLPLALLSCAIWTASYQAYRTNLNGYETVFAVSFLLLSVAAYVWRSAAASTYTYPVRDIVVGISLALAVYARIDLGLWALCAAIGFLFLSPEPLKRRLISVSIWALTAVLATLPFWYHNLTVGGSLMPISGKASAFQMSFHGFWTSVGNCFLRGFSSLGEVCFLSLYLPYSLNGNAVGLLAALVGISLMLWTLVFTNNVRNYLAHCIPKSIAIPILAFALLLFGYYVFAHGSWWFMRRYIHPERALFFAISGVYVCSLAYVVTRASSLQWLRSRSVVILSTIIAAVSVGQFAMTWGDKTSNQMYAAAEWINANIPASSKIGAFQSGTLGYFCNNVVNLDGKNNALALQAMTSGTGLEFIRDQNIDIVVDWPSQIAKYVDFESFRKEYEPISRVGAFEIYRRK